MTNPPAPTPAGASDPTLGTPGFDHHGGPRTRGLRAVTRSSNTTGKFGWLLRGLPPHKLTDEERDRILATLTEPPDGSGGWGASPAGEDNPAVPAVYTYALQMLDHDASFDPTSDGDRRQDPDALQNYRTPRLDLDSVYGSGPKASPHLYERNGNGRLLLSPDGRDLPRNQEGIALLGDPRDDVHVVVSQLHKAFINFHNTVLARVEVDPSIVPGAASPFEAAQQLVRWHWQWIVLHDVLPRVLGKPTMDLVLTRTERKDKRFVESTNLRLYKPHNASYLPVEFSGALFRFGHSMVRDSYRLNDGLDPIPTFSPATSPGEFDDLRGHRVLPAGWEVDWKHFAPLPGAAPTPSRLINSRLAPSLNALPSDVDRLRRSLALLNLNRGRQLELPSGEAFAAAVTASGAQLAGPTLEPGATGFTSTPLWLWTLKEAELTQGGSRLGPVAGRAVAEVITGLVARDPGSYLKAAPTWTPSLPSATAEDFTLADLLSLPRS